MRDYHVVSFSGGKDSTAMLLRMLELKMPVDEILFCDTGVEFPQMYDHLNKVEKYTDRRITILKAEHNFKYFLLDYERKYSTNKLAVHDRGLSFPGVHFRWCTRRLKTDVIGRHIKKLAKEFNVCQYVGIAADEQHRIKDLNYPLIDWGWTEADALAYCKEKGFDWGGLYDMFDRVSCWCCPFQSLKAVRALYDNFPNLWAELKDWQTRTYLKFKPKFSVEELEIRFALEDEFIAKGLPIGRNRAFQKELKNRLGRD